MSAPQTGECLDIVRSLALFLRDQRDAVEIVSAAVRSIDDRLPRGVVRIWLSKSTKHCSNCTQPAACETSFHCLQLEASAGETTALQDPMSNMAFGQGLPGIVGKNEHDHFCHELRGSGYETELSWCKEHNLTAFCGFPLFSAGRLLGVLGIYGETLPSEEARRNLSCSALLLSQALGSAFLRNEQERLSNQLEHKVNQRTAQLQSRVSDLEDTRRAMLNMMAEAFEAQRQMRQLTEKLEIMVEERTKELRAAKDEAVHANELKSQFLGRVSHEFRTPMHGMISFAKLGIRRIDRLDRDKTLFYFQQILESAGELLPLIDDLLDISRIESGKVDYNFEYLDLRALLFDIVGKYEPLFAERQLEIKITVSNDFPKRIRFDRKHMRQVFVNILGNAGKFGKPGTDVSVDLSCTKNDVVVRVADHGPGIPPAELSMIFDTFSQSTVTRGSFEGAGLGLAIACAIIESHDGLISVHNREEGGAEFLICLPWNENEANEALLVESQPIQQPIED